MERSPFKQMSLPPTKLLAAYQSRLPAQLISCTILVALFVVIALSIPLHAQTFTVLHRASRISGNFGTGELLQRPDGALFGTTESGGIGSCNHGRATGCGTVYQLSRAGKYRVLYSFLGFPDGEGPQGGVVRDAAGNLYGTTSAGGPNSYGTVFKLDATGKETILYAFTGGADGEFPNTGLVRDGAGNLYGATELGGPNQSGTIFKLDTAGNETVLHAFTGSSDGRLPQGPLLLDVDGSLYGTTYQGGDLSCGSFFGCGVVFKIDAAGSYSVLHTFELTDGASPYVGLARDSQGNLYGTTAFGGTRDYGVIFEIDTAGNYSTLYNFNLNKVGVNPGEVVVDPQGLVYTTTTGSAGGSGTVLKLHSTGAATVLHTFENSDGAAPFRLLLTKSGVLYGSTLEGGVGGCLQGGCGVIFSITP
jgi:uncharacterized repeat protein (TIGR03803 family)